MKRILVDFRIEKDSWEKFGQLCGKFGVNRSKLLRAMIDAVLADEDLAILLIGGGRET